MAVHSGQVASTVLTGVVQASTRAGAEPHDAIMGASQGVIQGIAEAYGDLAEATTKTVEAVKEITVQAGVPEDLAIASATEGAIQAAEAIGPEAVAQVAGALPGEILTSEARGVEG